MSQFPNHGLQLEKVSAFEISAREGLGDPLSHEYEKVNIKDPVRASHVDGITTKQIRPLDDDTTLHVNGLRVRPEDGITVDNKVGTTRLVGSSASSDAFAMAEVSASAINLRIRGATGAETDGYTQAADTADDVLLGLTTTGIAANKAVTVKSGLSLSADTYKGTTTANSFTLGTISVADEQLSVPTAFGLALAGVPRLTLTEGAATLRTGDKLVTSHIRPAGTAVTVDHASAVGTLVITPGQAANGTKIQANGDNLKLSRVGASAQIDLQSDSIELATAAAGFVMLPQGRLQAPAGKFTLDFGDTDTQHLEILQGASDRVVQFNIAKPSADGAYELQFNKLHVIDDIDASELHMQAQHPTAVLATHDGTTAFANITCAHGGATSVASQLVVPKISAAADETGDLSVNGNWMLSGSGSGTLTSAAATVNVFSSAGASDSGLVLDTANTIVTASDSAYVLKFNTVNPAVGDIVTVSGLSIDSSASTTTLTPAAGDVVIASAAEIQGAQLKVNALQPRSGAVGVSIGGTHSALLVDTETDSAFQVLQATADTGFQLKNSANAELLTISPTQCTITSQTTSMKDLFVDGDITWAGDLRQQNFTTMNTEDKSLQFAKAETGFASEASLAVDASSPTVQDIAGAGFFVRTTESDAVSATYDTTGVGAYAAQQVFTEPREHSFAYHPHASSSASLGRFHATNQMVIGGVDVPHDIKTVGPQGEDDFIGKRSVLYVDEIRSYQANSITFGSPFQSAAGASTTVEFSFDQVSLRAEPNEAVFVWGHSASSAPGARVLKPLCFPCQVQSLSITTPNHTLATDKDQLLHYAVIEYDFDTGAVRVICSDVALTNAVTGIDSDALETSDAFTVSRAGVAPFTNAMHRVPASIMSGDTFNVVSTSTNTLGDGSGAKAVGLALWRDASAGSLAELGNAFPEIQGAMMLSRVVA